MTTALFRRTAWGVALAALALTTACSLPITVTKSPQPKPAAPSTGWRFINLNRFGTENQIRKLTPLGSGGLSLTVATASTPDDSKTTYSSATYDTLTHALSDVQSTAAPDSTYSGSYSLTFQDQTSKPTVLTQIVTASGGTIPWPTSVQTYGSRMTPQLNDPGSYDNAIIGQSGNWLWIALKGPENPPFPQLVWHYRDWNRLLAINVKTHAYHVYPIPKSTNRLSDWSDAPSFAVVKQRVWVGVQDWLGNFSTNPAAGKSAPVLAAPPATVIAARQKQMLSTLTSLRNQAAQGLAIYWNTQVMQNHTAIPDTGNANQGELPWIMDPDILNHGDFPLDIYWCADFPLQKDGAADKERNQLMRQILTMSQNPLTTAYILYNTPSAMQAHFHSQPPLQIPGYTIRNGLYYASGSTTTNS